MYDVDILESMFRRWNWWNRDARQFHQFRFDKREKQTVSVKRNRFGFDKWITPLKWMRSRTKYISR